MKKLLLAAVLEMICLPLLADQLLSYTPAEWKIFPWVKNGIAGINTTADGIPLIQITANPDKGAIHFFLDKEIPIGKNTELELSFQWKNRLNTDRKSHFACGVYLFDTRGKYIGKAHPYFNHSMEHSDWKTWQNFVQTKEIPSTYGETPLKFGKVFFSVTAGGTAEIRNFKALLKTPDAADTAPRFTCQKPILPPDAEFHTGRFWTQKNIGPREFYVAEQGNYVRINREQARRFETCGIFPDMIRGHVNAPEFKPGKSLNHWMAESRRDFLDNQYPMATMNYQRMAGHSAPDPEVIREVNAIWIGDGQAEEPIYRLEPVFHFLETGKKWRGSSMYLWKDKYAVDYLKNELMPLLEKEIPGCSRPDFQWDRDSIQILKDLYCLTYLSVNPRPFIITMYLSPFAIAENRKNLISVSAKAADPEAMAILRGVTRQSGGNKFLHCWRGHESLERYGYPGGAWFNAPSRENWGLPYPQMIYYIFRPYLAGMNYYTNETFPANLIKDPENNGTWHLTETGRQVRRLLQFAEDHPHRGIPYTPVAFLMGWNRSLTERAYGGKITFDKADWMNRNLIKDLLLPEHRHARPSGGYSGVAPYGEIMDILKPDSRKDINADILDGYKLLILGGGITLNPQYITVLQQHVKNGGSLLVNAADARKYLTADFTGVEIGDLHTAKQIRNETTGKVHQEPAFTYFKLKPRGAKTLYSVNSSPAVTIFPYGKGHVLVTAPEHLISSDFFQITENNIRRRDPRPRLLNFCGELFENLFDSVSPFTVKVPPESKNDFSWIIFRKGNRWTVNVMNYSLEKEKLVLTDFSTAKVTAEYPYREIPFEIRANVPVKDVVELFSGRDVNTKYDGGRLLVSESMRGGDLRLYEFSKNRITLPVVKRHVNYALNQKITASSVYKSYEPGCVVDGKRSNSYFWQSGTEKRIFKLPQWLTVDLGCIREIDHIFLQFHVWNSTESNIRQHFYQYEILASEDNRQWKKIIDESRNSTPADMEGTETWFAPVKARYVKLVVLHNSGNSGASVVELTVMGKEKKSIQLQRKSIIPPWKVTFPPEIAQARKISYLMDRTPVKVSPGWMPQGKKWHELNGEIKLFTEIDNLNGSIYRRSLYGESCFEAEYAVPYGAEYFAAVCGFGNRSRKAAVEFKVYVDGKLQYDSGIFRIGQPLLPVVVKIKNGRKIKLVTTDGGDGIIDDYAWWGNARFILK